MRAVASTYQPALRNVSTNVLPKPRFAPVMNTAFIMLVPSYELQSQTHDLGHVYMRALSIQVRKVPLISQKPVRQTLLHRNQVLLLK